MNDIRFIISGGVIALDQRVPVNLVWVDDHGTATVEFYDGQRALYGVDKLLPGECYICEGTAGEFKIEPYGGRIALPYWMDKSCARLRCVHVGLCDPERLAAITKARLGTARCVSFTVKAVAANDGIIPSSHTKAPWWKRLFVGRSR